MGGCGRINNSDRSSNDCTFFQIALHSGTIWMYIGAARHLPEQGRLSGSAVPPKPGNAGSVHAYVLSPFSRKERLWSGRVLATYCAVCFVTWDS